MNARHELESVVIIINIIIIIIIIINECNSMTHLWC